MGNSKSKHTAASSGTPPGHGEPPTPSHANISPPRRRGRCLLVNETDRTLYLFDKISGAIAKEPRYTIPANGWIEVESLSHTFYRMVVYAIQEDEDDGTRGSGGRAQVTIDTDQMAEHKKIVIRNSTGGNRTLETTFS